MLHMNSKKYLLEVSYPEKETFWLLTKEELLQVLQLSSAAEAAKFIETHCEKGLVSTDEHVDFGFASNAPLDEWIDGVKEMVL